MLNIFKNLITKTNNKMTLNAVQFVSMGAFLLIMPFGGQVEKTTYETRIEFDKENPINLTVPEKKVEIYSAGSREDVNNLDTEAIKGLMKIYGEKYGIDWKLVYAIGYHESGNYSSSLARRNNNFFGRKAKGGGYTSWATPEEGIENEFVYLKTRYFDRGLTTPSSINRVYAEDREWHYKVEAVIASL